jgi:hypothetical protein
MYLLVFAFLTFWRALSNINFWMDWTAWLDYMEIGVGILIAANLNKIRYLFLLILPFVASFLIYRSIGYPQLITNLPPAGIVSISKLAEIANQHLVFTSGSGVFWLNAFYNTPQLRGGRDEVSINTQWLPISYIFRDGKDKDAIYQGLNNLKVKYVLVNTPESPDYYHDFTNIDKWKMLGDKIWEEHGDVIYSLEYP